MLETTEEVATVGVFRSVGVPCQRWQRKLAFGPSHIQQVQSPRAREVILIVEGPDSLGVAVNGIPVDGADETRKENPGLVS